jgi:hypothetical protein
MRPFLISTMSGLLAALFTLFLEHRLLQDDWPPLVEVVDLQQLLTEQVAEVGRQKLSADQQRAAATAYATALNTALDEVARTDHAVLLVKPAVLTGGIDVTGLVRTHIRLALDPRAVLPAGSTITAKP